MTDRTFPYLFVVMTMLWSIGQTVMAPRPAHGQSPQPTVPAKPMTTYHATGTFEVNMSPQGEGEKVEGIATGRLLLDKTFHGGIEGKGKGEMLTAMSAVPGSAGYVAIERVTGTVDGRGGSFVFQHAAMMTRGTPDLSITVVPDSGTGQLKGITGRFTIKIAEGKHSYDFEYTLPGEG